MGAKTIKDPVHGYISIDKRWVDSIVDTRYFQRLRNIRQVDTTRTVYPSANHTRFSHSLGVYHLARKAFDSIRSDPEFQEVDNITKLKRTLECACLCHDIGHFPFSHLGERFADHESIWNSIERSDYDLRGRFEEAGIKTALEREEIKSHELMSCAIVLCSLSDSIEEVFDCDIQPTEVCAFILGTSTNRDEWQWEATASLLSSEIDVDRLDYMQRDDQMSGANLVSIDSGRMVDAYTTVGGNLALSTKAHSTIGNYLQGRNKIYLWVAQHHKVVYSNAIVELLIRELHDHKDKDGFQCSEVIEYGIDDAYLIEQLRSEAKDNDSTLLATLFDRYQRRDYLSSCWKHAVDWREKISSGKKGDLHEQLEDDRYQFERRLQEELDLGRHEVIARNSTVSGYNFEDLSSIHLDHNGDDELMTQFPFYERQQDLYTPVPYVYVPSENVDQAIDELQDMRLPL